MRTGASCTARWRCGPASTYHHGRAGSSTGWPRTRPARSRIWPDRLKIDAGVIQPGVDGLVTAGMVDQRLQGAKHEFHLTSSGNDALVRLTEARRAGLTDLLEGWNPQEHPEVIEMVKELAHALLADDERMVADAMPHDVATAAAGGAGGGGGGGA